MRRLLLALICLASLVRADGERVWTRLAWRGVEMLTTSDPSQAQAALAELESLHRRLAAAVPELTAAGSRLRIVAFGSGTEYEPYRWNAWSPAYYAGGPDWAVVVVADLGERNRFALRHEYVHHLLRSAGQRLPLWLEEGLADALAPLPADEADSRIRLLRKGNRIPWSELTRARPAAFSSAGWDAARLFYAQSWALTEALIRKEEGRLGLTQLASWTRADSFSEGELESLLRKFLKRPRSVGRRWKLAPAGIQAEPAPAPAGLVWAVLGRLSVQLGRHGQAELLLRNAALLWPEALPWLGDLHYRLGRLAEARQAWRRAMALDMADGRTLFRLAVLEQDLAGGDPVPVLERLLEVDGSNEEARLALAAQYIRRGLWSKAWQRLHEVQTAPPRWSAFYQQALAFTQSRVPPSELLGTN